MKKLVLGPAASVYSNGKFIVVETCSGRGRMQLDPQAPRNFLEQDASEEAIGQAVLSALAHSREISMDEVATFFDLNRTMENYRQWVASLMERYGYKTKRALFKNMKNCGVRHEDGNISFEPMRHVKLEEWEGMTSDGSDKVIVSEESPLAEIGSALLTALSRCSP